MNRHLATEENNELIRIRGGGGDDDEGINRGMTTNGKFISQKVPKRTQTRIDDYFNNHNRNRPMDIDNNDNLMFGDAPSPDKHGHTRLVSANVNGISANDNFAKLHILGRSADIYNIDYLGLIETNLDYNHGDIGEKCNNIVRKYFKQTNIKQASSEISFGSPYQPGGVMSIMSYPWATRCKTRSDPSSMGRWTESTVIGQRNRKVTIITAYTVCPQSQAEIGSKRKTAFTQQWHMIKRSNAHLYDIDPRTIMMEDLSKRIKLLKDSAHEVIILMDANDSLQQLNSPLTDWVKKNNLIDIIVERHGTEDEPATYARGSQRIDYIFTTPMITEYVSAAGIFPLQELCFSDHRATFVDIDLKGYLGGELPDSLNRHSREVHSNDPRSVKKFQQCILQSMEDNDIESQIEAIKSEMSNNGDKNTIGDKLEKIDILFTTMKLECEKKSGNTHKLPWSPQLKNAIHTKTYWSLWLSESRSKGKYDFKEQRRRFINEDTEHYEDMQHINRNIIMKQLKISYQKLKDTQLKSQELREAFLEERAKMALDGGKTDVHAIINAIKRAEARKRMFSKLKSFKCKSISHGIDHIIVENKEGQRITIHEPEQMIDALLKQNIKHFSQADGTPFTIDPLKSLLGRTGTSQEAQDILNGKTDIASLELNEAVDSILHQLQKTLTHEVIDTDITTEDVINGYKRWSEYTSTSPSGTHLGLDKAILRFQKTQEKEANESSSVPLFQRYFSIKAFLIDSALKTGHVYKRWTKVVNALIEKLPGTPLITKLRVIHLIESDFNLMIGIIWGRRLVWSGEDSCAFHDGQGGSRPCRRTQELLLHKHLQYSILRLSKRNGASFDNDAKSCFDRIVMPLASLAAQQLGLPPSACELFLNTLDKMKYHIKTTFGISEESYYTTMMDTIHGPGQGGRGSPGVWVIISSMIMHCMELKSKGCTLINPYNKDDKYTNWITGFVDDITHWCSDPDRQGETEAVTDLQVAAQWWEKLLNATGGKLELSKCFFYIIQWDFDKEGIAKMRHKDCFKQEVHLECSESLHQVTIPQRNCDEAHKTLGIMERPDGTNDDELKRITEKSNTLIQRISSKNITRYEAKLYYFTTYIPSITYGFACGTHTKKQLDKIQRRAIPHLSAAMGFTRSTPNAVKFGPVALGGIGLRRLFVEQGTEKCCSILRYLRCDRPVSKILKNQLLWTQKVAGVSQSILSDVHTDLPHIKTELWVTTLRDYLKESCITIDFPEMERNQLQCGNDKYIMDLAIRSGYKNQQLEMINRCRIFLQCTTLSDICSADGTEINVSSYNCEEAGIIEDEGEWPVQTRPGILHIRLWRTFIRNFCNESSMILCEPLENWSQESRSIRCKKSQNIWVHQESLEVFKRNGAGWMRGDLSFHRKYWTIKNIVQADTENMKTRELLPADNFKHQDNKILWRGRITTSTTRNNDEKENDDDVNYGIDKEMKNLWKEQEASLPTWVTNVTAHTTLHVPLSEILQLLETKGIVIECASDGGLSDNIGSYGWIFANAGIHLVSGKGFVPGFPLSSQRAEACGKLSWVSWLARIIECYNVTIQCTIKSYCDNKSVVEKTSRNNDYSNPSHTLSPNFDIFKSIYIQQQKIPKLSWINTSWIKGHQDSTRDISELDDPARLNIHADTLATQALASIKNGSLESIQYPFPNGIVTLINNGTPIHSQETYALRWSYSEYQLQQYYAKELFQTSETQLHQINWAGLRLAREKLSYAEWVFSVKQMTGWLPTGTKMKQYGDMVTHCPLCSHENETVDHLWICPSRAEKNVMLVQEFSHFLSEIETNIIIIRILTQQVSKWLNVPNSTNQEVSDVIRLAVGKQNTIGWNFFLRGIIINDWAFLQEQHWIKEGGHKLGDSWSAAISEWWIRKSRTVWLERNEKSFNTETNSESKLEQETYAQVRQLYKSCEELSATDRELFSSPIEDMLTQPWQSLKIWVATSWPTVKACIAAQKERLLRNQPRIEELFLPQKQPTESSVTDMTQSSFPENMTLDEENSSTETPDSIKTDDDDGKLQHDPVTMEIAEKDKENMRENIRENGIQHTNNNGQKSSSPRGRDRYGPL